MLKMVNISHVDAASITLGSSLFVPEARSMDSWIVYLLGYFSLVLLGLFLFLNSSQRKTSNCLSRNVSMLQGIVSDSN